MKNKTKIIIERGLKKYEVLFDYDCMGRCSFRVIGFKSFCEDKCHLPKWFKNIINAFMDKQAYLREIKEGKGKGKI